MRLPYALLLFSSVAVAAQPSFEVSSSNGKVRIQRLPDAVVEDRIAGCTCGFSVAKTNSSSTSDIVVGWTLGQTTAYMQINDRLEQFQVFDMPSGPAGNQPREPVLGDAADWLLRGQAGQVVLHTRTSHVCGKLPGCEVVGFDGTAQVTTGQGQLSFGVTGWCGC